MNPLKGILANLRPSPRLVGMDSNLHHELWNPPSYTHTHRESEELVNLMHEAGLLLSSETGIPTFISNQARAGETTVDLQWMSLECYDWATVCKTDTSFECFHLSDHLAITTKLNLPAGPTFPSQPRTSPNWSKTNWETYATSLSGQLTPILTTLLNPSETEVDAIANNLTEAVNLAVKASTPTLTINQKLRRWWCVETPNPLKGHANNLRRRAQRTRTH